MKNKILIDYPNKLNIIFEKLDLFDIKPILIGGYIRDKFLNLESKDIDIELYGVNSLEELENILEEFGSINRVGKSFGVCKLFFEDLDIDFTLPRRDSKIDNGHRGFQIETDGSLDFKTATSRRDFTINAIGYDVKNKTILDPFNGLTDLKEKTLRAVDLKTFGEDPLRVLRAVQFSSRLNFSLENKLIKLCRKLVEKGTLQELAAERIFEEFQKLLLKSKKPSIGFLLLKELHTFRYFHELSTLNEKSFIDMINSLDRYIKTNKPRTDIILMLSLICADMSKKETLSFLSKLTNNKEILESVNNYRTILTTLDLKKFSDYKVYKLATQVNIELFTLLLKAKFEDKKTAIDGLLKQAEHLGVKTNQLEALIKGRDLITLGMKPSKKFAQILAEVYDAQLHHKFYTYDKAIQWLKDNLL